MSRKRERLGFPEQKTAVDVVIAKSNLNDASYASIKMKKTDLKSLVQKIVARNGVSMEKETLFYAANLLGDGILRELSEGKAVELLALGTIFPRVKGKVSIDDSHASISEKICVGFTPSAAAKEAVKSIKVRGKKKAVPQHYIDYVFEKADKKAERKNFIRRNQLAVIKSMGIKLASDFSGLVAVKCDSGERIEIKHVTVSERGRTEFFADELGAGEYKFIVSAAYNANSSPLKKCVEVESPRVCVQD